MKKIKIIVLLLFTFSVQTIYSQKDKNNSGYIDAYNFTPKENIFVHYNTSLLFSGEYLYYKIYCINATLNQLSTLSKVAYIELINEEKQRVFRHKINLKNGLGQGDFFISTKIPSGNYKIIAYTQWMKNGGKNYFFRDDINIVNPYMTNQNTILDTTKISIINISKSSNKNISNYIKLSTNNKVFNKRTEVTLTIKTLKDKIALGNYSLSIRKIDTINHSLKLTSSTYKKLYAKNVGIKYDRNTDIFYPEINGGLISGRVLNKNNNLPAQGQNVSISISDKKFIFKAETTDEHGIFDLSINENYDSELGIIQVLGEDRENYTVEIFETSSVDLSELTFDSFKVNPSMEEMILKRSIYNQIENGYYEIKPDTITSLAFKNPFYSGFNSSTYILDEYTKFPTIKEVFIEVIENVWSTKNKKNERVFYVRNNIDNNKNHPPLIFIDGVLIQNHQHLLDYNANKVKQIKVLRGEAYFGSAIYQGVIIVETIDGDYKNLLTGDYLQEVILFKPQPIKNHFKQTYSENNTSQRIPDFRNQLLWEPNVTLNSKEMVIHFYTSDNTGNYEICLEGFTKYGKAISLREVITVK